MTDNQHKGGWTLPPKTKTGPLGRELPDAWIAGFLHGVGKSKWDDMHDYAALCAEQYETARGLTRLDALLLAAVLRSRGKRNSLHDIRRAAIFVETGISAAVRMDFTRRALSAAMSCIASGEPWSPAMQDIFDKAEAELAEREW